MFINLSNHPSKNWCKEQTFAAKKYGDIIDITCPIMDASINEDQVKTLAEATINKINEINPAAIMCTGEFSFCYIAINELKKCGYKVFSTRSETKVSNSVVNGVSQRNIAYKFLEFVEYNDYSNLEVSKPKSKNNILLNCSWRFQKDSFDNFAIQESNKIASKIIDLPLEPIVHLKNNDEKEARLKNYIDKINDISPSVIILDGEFHTWYAMACLLNRIGYKVICKCSNREASETINADGTITKITNYKFVRYRTLEQL